MMMFDYSGGLLRSYLFVSTIDSIQFLPGIASVHARIVTVYYALGDCATMLVEPILTSYIKILPAKFD